MEKHRICKICNKRFSNGKAMGGHMRSHLTKLPLPPKLESPQRQQQLSDLPELSPPFSTPNRAMHSSTLVLNRSPSLDSAIHDGDSDTESHPKNPTRRRSKRRRKVIGKAAEPPSEAEQVSSVSDAFSTEDVARCLMMLSRDEWDNKVEVKKEVNESAEANEEDDDDDDEDDDEDDSVSRAQTRAWTQGKYKCETCNKVFRSYQALGGHRASHKKIKTQVFDEDDDEDFDEDFEEDYANHNLNDNGNKGNLVAVHQPRTFECSFCFKLFDSGQALGGHKKVHHYTNLTNHAARNVSSSSTNLGDNLVIDLNLPAPEEEDYEEITSQVEFSTVSD